MLTFIVMPCLNEANFIEGAAASLGFSPGVAPPEETELLIVDNGSTDGTLDILDRLAKCSRGRLQVFREPARGYVPPRHCGVEAAASIARSRHISAENVLILQADADTTYKAGYVAAMQTAAAGQRAVMLEGATRRPPDFEQTHPDYVRAERSVDERIEPLEAADEDEVVVDDKVCGYRLSDYRTWGGLFEEWTADGDAIHAETTRLFMRARMFFGARKVRVNPAGAASSRRRVNDDPWLQFATSGFPRERSWVSRWAHRHQHYADADAFGRAIVEGRETQATFLRRAHSLALFRFLPAIMATALFKHRADFAPDVRAALDALPIRSPADMAAHPGAMLTDVLTLIDTHPQLFEYHFSDRC